MEMMHTKKPAVKGIWVMFGYFIMITANSSWYLNHI